VTSSPPLGFNSCSTGLKPFPGEMSIFFSNLKKENLSTLFYGLCPISALHLFHHSLTSFSPSPPYTNRGIPSPFLFPMSTFFCVDNHIFFVNLSEAPIRRIGMLKIDDKIRHLIEWSLSEDIGKGDLTSEAIIEQDLLTEGTIVANEEGVIAGLEIAKMVFHQLDPNLVFESSFKDGNRVMRKEEVATLKGSVRSILSGERTALNFLQRLSGIATLTSKYVEKIKDTEGKILDTRKTTPGLRTLEKYAVKMGGGENHRMGLFDMILIKDNHIKAVGNISRAIQKAKAKYPKERIEVETKNLDEVAEAVNSGADWIMLDNMSVEEMKKAVKVIRSSPRKIKIEASGRIDLNNVREVALTGVNFISVGALTHSAPALDFSLLLVEINL
jgi:nicotinate-nucleotide pyrophosphorylase (carboxylating)